MCWLFDTTRNSLPGPTITVETNLKEEKAETSKIISPCYYCECLDRQKYLIVVLLRSSWENVSLLFPIFGCPFIKPKITLHQKITVLLGVDAIKDCVIWLFSTTTYCMYNTILRLPAGSSCDWQKNAARLKSRNLVSRKWIK